MLIYTCITQKYDTLKEPRIIDPQAKYVCITDTPIKRKETAWEFINIEDFYTKHEETFTLYGVGRDRWDAINSIRKQRVIKLVGFICFNEPKTMWIDGNVGIKHGLKPLFDQFVSSFMTFKHPIRYCTYMEGITCIDYAKGVPEEVAAQMRKYKGEGLPINSGMIHSSVVFRDNSKEIKHFCGAWCNELLNESHRDQLSFYYTLWKTGAKIESQLIPYEVLHQQFNYNTKHG